LPEFQVLVSKGFATIGMLLFWSSTGETGRPSLLQINNLTFTIYLSRQLAAETVYLPSWRKEALGQHDSAAGTVG
jgi:hypothetical protein